MKSEPLNATFPFSLTQIHIHLFLLNFASNLSSFLKILTFEAFHISTLILSYCSHFSAPFTLRTPYTWLPLCILLWILSILKIFLKFTSPYIKVTFLHHLPCCTFHTTLSPGAVNIAFPSSNPSSKKYCSFMNHSNHEVLW